MRSILQSPTQLFDAAKLKSPTRASRIASRAQRVALFTLMVLLLPLVGKGAAVRSSDIYGGIEIGGKGVKATVVKLTPSESGYDAAMLAQSSINVTITGGVEQNGKFSVAVMEEAAKAVNQLYTEMQEKHQVPPEHIYIVGSSGLLASNKSELAEKVKSATGKSMDFITVETEIKLSMIGIVPEKYYQEALYLDIGGGNTKGGYRKGKSASDLSDDNFVMVSVPYGTVTFTNAVTKTNNTPEQFEKQVKTLGKEVIATPIRKQIKANPGLAKRQRVYLTGGMIWAVVTLMHPESKETFTRLTKQDINQFYKLAVKNPKALQNPDLSKIADPKLREEAQQEVQRVNKTYNNPQNLIAGAKILQVAAQELKFKNKPVYFARYGQVAWLFSYVVQAARQ